WRAVRTTFLGTGAALGLGAAPRLEAAVVLDNAVGFFEDFGCCGLGNLGHPL
ncbi:hypothetical protein Zmor_021667, partial [Zophobas morio]